MVQVVALHQSNWELLFDDFGMNSSKNKELTIAKI